MIFESPHLYIRQFMMDDFEDFYLLNSDPVIVKYIREPQTREQALEFLREKIRYYADFPQYGSWAIVEKQGAVIAGIFMLRPSTSVKGHIELGYAFFKRYWGMGYATEIVHAALDYAFRQLHIPSLIAITHPENIASQKLLLKCNFSASGILTENGKTSHLFTLSNNFLVETPNLLIIPLNYGQLFLYLQADGKLEKELMLTDNGRTVSPDVKEVVTRFTLPNIQQARQDHYLFFTFWIVVEKATKTIVAELGFKGAPGKKGDIEIGYGTMSASQQKGYMTEAVGGMIGWAKGRPDVQYILAETDERNIASIRVVQKNNFRSFMRKGKMLWWKIVVKQ